MADYGSFVPEALKTSQNPTLATLGERLYLDGVLQSDMPYQILIDKTLDGTHTLIVTVDYLTFIQRKRGFTQSTYILEDKVRLVWPGIT